MKRNAVLTIVMVVTIVFFGCGKNDGNNSVIIDPKPTEADPQISVSVPAKPWYGDTVFIPYTTNNTKVLKAGGEAIALNGTYVINGVKNTTQIVFDALNITKTATQAVSFVPFQEQTTNLCKLNTLQRLWTNTSAVMHDKDGQHNTIPFSNRLMFTPNQDGLGGTMKSVNSGGTAFPGTWTFSPDLTHLRFSNLDWQIDSLTSTKLVTREVHTDYYVVFTFDLL